jgi:predicted ATPase
MLAALIHKVNATSQIIISTQSVNLINNFDPEDIIIVDRKDGASQFQRLQAEELNEWLETYTLGEVWEKNIIGGRPF